VKKIMSILLIVALVGLFAESVFAAPENPAPAVEVPTLAPAYVGTDYTIMLKVAGMSQTSLGLLLQDGRSLNFPLNGAGLGDLVMAYIPGSNITTPGELKFVVRGLSATG